MTKPPASPSRLAGYRLGLNAERLAAIVLILKGYRILQRRYKTPVGEIDIIAKRFNRLAFVEVKARKDEDAGLLSVTPAAQHRIRQAAQLWLKRNPAYQSCDLALDLILVIPGKWPRHMTDTFNHT